MLRWTNLSVPLDYTEASLRALVLRKLSLSPDQLLSLSLVRRSVDARDKQDVHFVLTLDLSLLREQAVLKACRFLSPAPVRKDSVCSVPSSPPGPMPRAAKT